MGRSRRLIYIGNFKNVENWLISIITACDKRNEYLLEAIDPMNPLGSKHRLSKASSTSLALNRTVMKLFLLISLTS
jgi:hypothetical protein